MTFRKLALAALLCAALSGVNASASTLTEDAGPDTGIAGDTDTFIGYGYLLSTPLTAQLDSLDPSLFWHLDSLVVQTIDPNPISAVTVNGITFALTSSSVGASGGTTDYLFTNLGDLTSGTLASFTFDPVGLNAASISYANLNVTAVVPEPETYAMLLAGLGALGFMSRRRKMK